jgi:hypothetical protein
MDFFLSLISILFISLLLHARFKLNAASSMLVSISSITLVLCFFGMIDLLYFGTLSVYIFALLCPIYLLAVKKINPKSVISEFITPGVVFFVFFSLLLYYLLMTKNAAFRVWDEFSFWGTAAKIVKQNNRLYTLFKSSIKNNSYAPALPLFSYYLQFFSKTFSEYKVYLSYGISIAATMSVLFSNLSWKNFISTTILSLFGLVSLYSLRLGMEGMPVYATSYADMQIGVIFAGAVLVWFFSGESLEVRFFSMIPVLGMLVYIKDIGLVLAMIAIGAVAIEILLSEDMAKLTGTGTFYKILYDYSLPLSILILILISTFFINSIYLRLFILIPLLMSVFLFLRNKKGLSIPRSKLVFKIIFPLVLSLFVISIYFLWNTHFSLTNQISREPKVYEYTIFQIISGKDAYFNEVLRIFRENFSLVQVVHLGPLSTSFILFLLLPILSGLITFKRKSFLKFTLLSVVFAAGFIVYYLFLAYLYTTQFYHYDNFWLPSFPRYVMTYFAGWMIISFGLLFRAAEKTKSKNKRGFFEKIKLNKNTLFAGAITLSYVFSIFFYAKNSPNYVHPDQYLLTSNKVRVSMDQNRQNITYRTSRYIDYLLPSDRIYFLCMESDGGEWFIANYEFMPAFTVDTLGKGNFVPPGTDYDKVYSYDVEATVESFSEYLRNNEVNLLFVYQVNAYFLEEFSDMFEDGLNDYYDGSRKFYHVTDDGEKLSFSPIYSGEQLDEIHGRTVSPTA